MRLYINGVLAGTHASTDSFAALRENSENTLGRRAEQSPARTDMIGRLDDLRVWSVPRNPEELRENMHRRLTGREPGLVGWWSFDDPDTPMRDSSTNGHHGRMFGRAETVQELPPTALLYGKVTDSTGAALSGAQISVHQQGRETSRTASDDSGRYEVMVPEECDLFVTTGKLSNYQLQFHSSGARQEKDWVLSEAENLKLPIANFQSRDGAFPPGAVAARALTDEHGNYDFPNVQPGQYQLRAQVLRGKAWFEAGRILYARDDMSDVERAALRSLEWQLAPFKKGTWEVLNTARGLADDNEIRKILIEPEGVVWFATQGGASRFDGHEFVNVHHRRRLARQLRHEHGSRQPGKYMARHHGRHRPV